LVVTSDAFLHRTRLNRPPCSSTRPSPTSTRIRNRGEEGLNGLGDNERQWLSLSGSRESAMRDVSLRRAYGRYRDIDSPLSCALLESASGRTWKAIRRPDTRCSTFVNLACRHILPHIKRRTHAALCVHNQQNASCGLFRHMAVTAHATFAAEKKLALGT